MKLKSEKASKTFRKKGTCSRTFTHILNRELGVESDAMERAADPLAGGILQKGHQCGMLWGSTLALGGLSMQKHSNAAHAKHLAISGAKKLVDSFREIKNTVNCRAITLCDFNNKWSFFKYIVSGRFLQCFQLADRWAPSALAIAETELNSENRIENGINCASEVIKKMHGSDEEQVMVAGFAGGLGLSGGGCGALGAAIWKKALDWSKENPGKSTFYNPDSKLVLRQFEKFTEGEMVCKKICGRTFDSVKQHSEFIENGGCKDLINQLADPVL